MCKTMPIDVRSADRRVRVGRRVSREENKRMAKKEKERKEE